MFDAINVPVQLRKLAQEWGLAPHLATVETWLSAQSESDLWHYGAGLLASLVLFSRWRLKRKVRRLEGELVDRKKQYIEINDSFTDLSGRYNVKNNDLAEEQRRTFNLSVEVKNLRTELAEMDQKEAAPAPPCQRCEQSLAAVKELSLEHSKAMQAILKQELERDTYDFTAELKAIAEIVQVAVRGDTPPDVEVAVAKAINKERERCIALCNKSGNDKGACSKCSNYIASYIGTGLTI